MEKNPKPSRSMYEPIWQTIKSKPRVKFSIPYSDFAQRDRIWKALVKRKNEDQARSGTNFGKLFKEDYATFREFYVWLSPAEAIKDLI